jgi:hypothetical protein
MTNNDLTIWLKRLQLAQAEGSKQHVYDVLRQIYRLGYEKGRSDSNEELIRLSELL